MSELACTIAALHVYPIKSCAGVSLQQALLVETGIEFDRAWMLVDPQGEMLTQRELPRMALVQPQFKAGELMLRAPGMLALHLRQDTVEAPTRVRVWGDVVKAYDMGALAAQWFSDFLGRPLRLVRFDPEQQRLADPQWVGDMAAETAFVDGYPLLVISDASLAELNTRLAARGNAPVTMQRFRPNLVLAGLQAHDEDHLHEIVITTDGGPVTLRLVKPCSRCAIPNIDPATATASHEPGDTLAGYRADARMQGAVTFGMNAVVVSGFERTLCVGQAATATLAFDAA
ncbi:MAG: MOSC N-terminal beta barrel domain-containing protein [Rubrivivax sp.]|nr:MOSC N-terminal beta barrel domain-containing protein [Rubrivivax sp.]